MATPFSILSVMNTDIAPVKVGTCYLKELFVANQAAADRWLKIYNKNTSATKNDAPVLRYRIPASSVGTLLRVQDGVLFADGLAFRATASQADTDDTAPTANDVTISGSYV